MTLYERERSTGRLRNVAGDVECQSVNSVQGKASVVHELSSSLHKGNLSRAKISCWMPRIVEQVR